MALALRIYLGISVLGLAACAGPCPEHPSLPTPATYRVAEAADPALIGATVTVTQEQLTIEYERDGVPVTVVYSVGERLD